MENGQSKVFCSQECYSGEQKIEMVYLKEAKDAGKIEELKKLLAEQKNFSIQTIQNNLNRAKVEIGDLEPNNRNYEQEINNTAENFEKIFNIKDRVIKDIRSKSRENQKKCEYCLNPIKGNVSYGASGKDGSHSFCSEECRERGMEDKKIVVKRVNVLANLLKLMEDEGIINISKEGEKLIFKDSKGSELPPPKRGGSFIWFN